MELDPFPLKNLQYGKFNSLKEIFNKEKHLDKLRLHTTIKSYSALSLLNQKQDLFGGEPKAVNFV